MRAAATALLLALAVVVSESALARKGGGGGGHVGGAKAYGGHVSGGKVYGGHASGGRSTEGMSAMAIATTRATIITAITTAQRSSVSGSDSLIRGPGTGTTRRPITTILATTIRSRSHTLPSRSRMSSKRSGADRASRLVVLLRNVQDLLPLRERVSQWLARVPALPPPPN